MRILFLAHAYPRFARDPVGSFIANLAVALRERDVDVVVSAPHAPGLPLAETIDGIAVHRFRYAPDRHETLAYTGTMSAQVRERLSGRVAMASYLAAAYRHAARLAREERVDAVHAHWWFPGGLVAAGLRRSLRLPYLVTLHGSDLRLATGVPMGERLFRVVAGGAGGMTAVSSWLARGAEAIAPAMRVRVAPMPVRIELFHPADAHEPGRLLFIGKLSEQKGLHRLLNAMSRMTRPATLAVVGAGRVDDRALVELANRLGLERRIEWLPLLTQEELAEQYRRAAIHVIPALDEGLGLTAVEAMLSETPVVGFESGGLPDIIADGETGRLIPPGDEGAMAAALDALVADPERLREMGAAGRRRALRVFSPSAAAQCYAAEYASLLAR